MIYSPFSCLNYPYPYFVIGIGPRGIVERGQVQLRIEIAIALRKIAVARKQDNPRLQEADSKAQIDILTRVRSG